MESYRRINIMFLLLGAVIFSNCSQKSTSVIEQVATDKAEVVDQSWRSEIPKPGPAPTINIGASETFTLDNGLQVIVVENHKIPQVSLQIALKNDPIIEGDQVGFVSMAGDLMGRGTTTKTKADIDEAIDRVGASLSTSGTGMFGRSLTKHLDVLLEVMTDVLYNPSFPEDELEKIRKQALSAIEASRTSADYMLANMRAKILYGEGHPYGEVQTPDHINRISLEKCRDYYNKFFIPNNAYLVIVGDITPPVAKAMAERYFSSWQKKPFKPVSNREIIMPSGQDVHIAHRDGAVQSVINVTYPVDLKIGDPDAVAASMVNIILGAGPRSRLEENIREDHGYAYFARSSLSPDPLMGSFRAFTEVRNEVTDSAVNEMMYELNRIVNEVVDEEELQTMKNYQTGAFARAMESPQTVARFALNTIRYNLPDDYYQTYLQRLNALTPDDVYRVARKYIQPSNAQIMVAGSREDIADVLTQFDDDGQIDFYDAFGDGMEYDASVLPEGVDAESIVENYLDAIGGRVTLEAIKSLYHRMSTEMMGQKLSIESYYQEPGKFAMSVGNGTMVFQESVFDGEKAMVSAMGQKQVMTEGPQFESLRSQAVMFPQLDYNSESYQLELVGMEDIDGTSCYKISIENTGTGQKSSEYYDAENYLLRRSTSAQDNPQGGSITITTDFSDYAESEGIRYPGAVKISGAMPTPLQATMEEYTINPDLPDDRFKVE